MAGAHIVIAALFGCGSPGHTMTAFDGRDSQAWLTYDDVEVHDVTPASLFGPFRYRARSRGCRTEGIGRRGVAAYCFDGGIALILMPGSRVRIGCEKPTTRDSCEELLSKISETRPRDYNAFGS